MKKIALSQPNNGCKATIEYPCLWQYKVIGPDRKAILAAIAECAGTEAYIVTDSHVSRHGRYKSLNMEIVVKSEVERFAIQQCLVDHPAVKVVL